MNELIAFYIDKFIEIFNLKIVYAINVYAISFGL